MLAVRINQGPELSALPRLDAAMALASLVALTAAVPVAVYGAGVLARRLRDVSRTARRISNAPDGGAVATVRLPH